MKLLYSPTSPYSAKNRMAAHYLGFSVEAIAVDTSNTPQILSANNPLGKIPVLLLEDGRAIFDSVVIMQFLDRESGGKLFPTDHQKRTEVEVFEALCDGALDSLLSIVYERRFRPAEFVYQPWIDKQWKKAVSSIDYIEEHLPEFDGQLNASHFALAALVSYLNLRFDGLWQEGHSKLVSWEQAFAETFPAYSQMKSGV